ncbi:MAG: DNA topoisomerase I [Thiotrichales bacterium]
MSQNLVIVESPAKAKTIKKYLGKGFEVLASYGHVRDLVPKNGAVDPDQGFLMKYEVIERNLKHVEKIIKAMKDAQALYLATDPDREGEAISWHLYEILNDQGLLRDKQVHRVVFHEITRRAVEEAIAHPRALSLDLINAQQARRALDYLVGFNLSPLLWKKIRRGLSAGRVQSPALRLIVEREEEIERFVSQEYWSIEADLNHRAQPFSAKLNRFHDAKVEQFSFTNEAVSLQAQAELLRTANGWLDVAAIEKKQRKRQPSPPFITSTLQQEASRKLGFTTRNTMRVAQQLYEGIDLGAGPIGLISYMRTDSVNLAEEALTEIRDYIVERFGAENLPEAPRRYKTKAKNAQEAHEAIRPTSVLRTPDEVKGHLSSDQFRLYELIWKRTVACQMIHATFDTVAVDLACGPRNAFRATGSTLRHPGFIAVYQEGTDEQKGDGDSEGMTLPDLSEGDRVQLLAIRPEQHFTEPPPRFTEASLVKTLEEYGIGRPSTYASIISTLLQREYAELESRRFRPTDVGRIVNNFLTQHFHDYVDYEFTARLEDELDGISRGEQEWVPVMENFWQPFKALVGDKETSVSRDEVNQARELGVDPATNKSVSVRMGRFGPFAQIGTKDDEEKPRFAGLRPGQRMDSITLDDALALFQLPRELGHSDEGDRIVANVGRFGPYVQCGKKYISLKQGDDPYTVDLPRALELIEQKRQLDANRLIQDFPTAGIQVLNGRFGPYVTDGKRNAKIPKGEEPAKLDLLTCQSLLAESAEKRGRGGAKSAAAETQPPAPEDKRAASKTTSKTAAAKKPKTKTASKTKTKATGDGKKRTRATTSVAKNTEKPSGNAVPSRRSRSA